MTTDEVIDNMYRKVSIGDGLYVFMIFGKVDFESFIGAVWNGCPEKEALLKALPIVAEKYKNLMHGLLYDEKQLYFLDFYTSEYDKIIRCVFLEAKVPYSVLFDKQNGTVWNTIREKANKTRISSECDRTKRNIEFGSEFLQEHYDEFVEEYQEYQSIARSVRELRKSKRRKIQKK